MSCLERYFAKLGDRQTDLSQVVIRDLATGPTTVVVAVVVYDFGCGSFVAIVAAAGFGDERG